MKDRFQFKQFLVMQDRCAMKVCTDSCILGAYPDLKHARTILDIGTGLLALMLAQRSTARIVGLEIDQASAQQAAENVERSPWNDRIQILHIDAVAYAQSCPDKFEVIISNPPFFQNSLKSPQAPLNHAKHDAGLSLDKLAYLVDGLLENEGVFWVMLPENEMTLLRSELSQYFLHEQKRLIVKTTAEKPIFRVISEFSRQTVESPIADLLVINHLQDYTPEFKALLKDYYLYLG